jgi:hypothetical protein
LRRHAPNYTIATLTQFKDFYRSFEFLNSTVRAGGVILSGEVQPFAKAISKESHRKDSGCLQQARLQQS